MARASLKDFCHTKGYNRVSKVRANTNGYKYVTLLEAENTTNSENLYLGQRYGEDIEIDTVLPINELFVAEITNADGEVRIKLTDKSGELSAEKAAAYQSI